MFWRLEAERGRGLCYDPLAVRKMRSNRCLKGAGSAESALGDKSLYSVLLEGDRNSQSKDFVGLQRLG